MGSRRRWVKTDRPSGESDEALVARAQTDGAVFALLYDRYVDPVYRYCYRRLGDVAAAEDATSLVFVRALSALPHFEASRNSFRSWLFAIAHNALVDTVRSASYRLHRPLEAAADLADPAASPDDLAVDAEQRRSVAEALAALPDEQRRIVELRLAGLNGPEIAATVGKSHTAVRTAQRRAIARLRTLLRISTDGEDRDG